MGPGDKSLVNLPVTQLLAVVTSEPPRPQKGKQQNERDIYIVSRRRLPCWGQGVHAVTLAPCGVSTVEAFASSFSTQASQASQLPEIGQNVQADGRAWRLGQTHKPFWLQAKDLFC